MEFERPSPKLLIIAFGFLVSAFTLGYALGRSLSTFTLSAEVLLSALPVLFLLFLTASLAIIFALTAKKEITVLGALIAAVLFSFPLTSLSLPSKLVVALTAFLSLLILGSQARRTHEAYTDFSAEYYTRAMRNFFLLFVFILGIILFFSTSQALGRQRLEIPEETLEPIVAQFVETVGGMLKQQFRGKIPESELAPLVEKQLVQLLDQVGLKLELEGRPKAFAQVTTRISKSLKTELDKVITPVKIYIPFVVAGATILTLIPLVPFVGLVEAPIFFLVYRFLIMVRVLKFEEMERTVKRLALA